MVRSVHMMGCFMDLWTLRLYRLASVAICMSLGVSAANAARPPPLLSAGSSFGYRTEFSGTFWNGEKRAFTRESHLTAKADNLVEIVSASLGSPTTTSTGTLAADGTIAAKGDVTSGYNTMARAMRGAPADLAVGTAWKTTIPVQILQDQTTDLPMTVTVASSEGDTVTLQGTGAQDLETTFGPYPVPINVSARLALRFAHGRFESCRFSANEVVHAGPQTQTMAWTFALDALPTT